MTAAARYLIGFQLVLAGLVIAACRDHVSPFEARSREAIPDSMRYRLTLNPGDDRSPVWSRGGDTVYYSAEGFEPLPTQPGVLVALPVEGQAVAREVLTNVQLPGGSQRWLAAPALDPTRPRLAFTEVQVRRIREVCPATTLACEPAVADAPLPTLLAARIYVRDLDASGPLEQDTALDVAFPGVTSGPVVVDGLPLTGFTVRVFPFYEAFERERAFIFRPTWAPDGAQLAFSDGLRIQVWTVGEDAARTVPNTEDGIAPAWSPTGDWIAFARLERADSSKTACIHSGALGPICFQERTDYVAGSSLLNLVRPDGTALRELGEGEQPAWGPDGRSLYFRRNDEIWRSDLDSGTTVPVPGTRGGREPAVSPNGRRLAFTRIEANGAYDLWIVRLDSGP